MPDALLLGRPLHHERYPAPGSPETLAIAVDVQDEVRTQTGYGGSGYTPRRETRVTYYRLQLGTGPPNALVYARKDYEPQEDDIEKVYATFG